MGEHDSSSEVWSDILLAVNGEGAELPQAVGLRPTTARLPVPQVGYLLNSFSSHVVSIRCGGPGMIVDLSSHSPTRSTLPNPGVDVPLLSDVPFRFGGIPTCMTADSPATHTRRTSRNSVKHA